MKEVDGIRISDTGWIRNSAIWKLQYSKYIHPLAEFSYAQYMKSHQMINGEFREWDNRQKGLWEESLYDGLIRHVRCYELLDKGYSVLEYKVDGQTERAVGWDEDMEVIISSLIKNWYEYWVKDKVETLNAIRFNTEALKLYELGVYDA